MATRHRSRHLHASLFAKLTDELTALGWVMPPIQFGTDPVTLVDYQPDERVERIEKNTVAVTLGESPTDVDEELGALVGGARSAFYPVFIDVYMREQALTTAICDDIRDIFEAQVFQMTDFITGLDAPETVEIEEVVGPERPAAQVGAEQFKRYWRIMRLGVRLYYQT